MEYDYDWDYGWDDDEEGYAIYYKGIIVTVVHHEEQAIRLTNAHNAIVSILERNKK